MTLYQFTQTTLCENETDTDYGCYAPDGFLDVDSFDFEVITESSSISELQQVKSLIKSGERVEIHCEQSLYEDELSGLNNHHCQAMYDGTVTVIFNEPKI